MVLMAKGKPDFVKNKQQKDKKIEKWYWDAYINRKTTKYKTYAILINEELSEFGDI
jgi:hypothetical protein